MLNIEVSPNLEYLITIPGFLKLLTVIFGAIVVTLGGYSQEDEDHLYLWKERFLLVEAIVCFLISFFYLLASCFSDQLVCNKINKGVDFSYHLAAGVLQLVSGSLMLNSAVILKKTDCKIIGIGSPPYCEYFEEKIGAGVLAIMNGIIYLVAAGAIYKIKSL